MIVFVDTSVWSLALRRKSLTKTERQISLEFSDLVKTGLVGLIGPVRQELLTGIKDRRTFELLRERMRGFDDTPLLAIDFETAAQFCNHCRSKGVQGSPTDFLLCAVAARHDASIYTIDRDFLLYAKHLKIRLHKPLSR